MGLSLAASCSNPIHVYDTRKTWSSSGASGHDCPQDPDNKELPYAALGDCGIGWARRAVEPPPRVDRRACDDELQRMVDEQRQRHESEARVVSVQYRQKRQAESGRLLRGADDRGRSLRARESPYRERARS